MYVATTGYYGRVADACLAELEPERVQFLERPLSDKAREMVADGLAGREVWLSDETAKEAVENASEPGSNLDHALYVHLKRATYLFCTQELDDVIWGTARALMAPPSTEGLTRFENIPRRLNLSLSTEP